MDIIYSNEQEKLELPKSLEELMHKAIEKVLEVEGIDNEGEVSVTIVDNDEIKEINRMHRDKDSVTDVLSFPQYDQLLEMVDTIDYLVLGDIILSAERAAEQAKDFGHSIERECVYLTVHSMYHLLGFDHMTDADKAEMLSKEEHIMSLLDVARG